MACANTHDSRRHRLIGSRRAGRNLLRLCIVNALAIGRVPFNGAPNGCKRHDAGLLEPWLLRINKALSKVDSAASFMLGWARCINYLKPNNSVPTGSLKMLQSNPQANMQLYTLTDFVIRQYSFFHPIKSTNTAQLVVISQQLHFRSAYLAFLNLNPRE
ncbi:uncharacterized protein BDR25DRAFT_355972 [Lindgomyces ingoldianus]|uniref:Uncharacterized protein n=1 Tax=Lindgomyces ingoldianus TaxID=673940 RepID=A0ACB6QRR7_9PLEO|nr:uncharacterized protein BDR25DRAFT_355972 [Lindgomyces ingoldianus]KAF2469714.1 hypothetical protein BDR25DRAFT_355972 [Lindgomyces ingoldianus]